MTITQTHAAVDCQNLGVRYGRIQALDQTSFTVESGQVYAMLGRNGSGKTSLIRCLLGHQKPCTGRVNLFGQEVWSARTALMQRVGVVAEEPDAPPTMTPRQLLKFCARLYPGWDAAASDERLRRFRVPMEIPFGKLSRGQKAQLSLTLALGPRPELLVLDDPTLGLDAVARREVYEELLSELADRGTTIFITTHDLAGIEGIADRVGILHGGRLLLDGKLEDLKARYTRSAGRPSSRFSPRTWLPMPRLGSGRAPSVARRSCPRGIPADCWTGIVRTSRSTRSRWRSCSSPWSARN
jgi:ABC-2 type transport system ATP-binding protein